MDFLTHVSDSAFWRGRVESPLRTILNTLRVQEVSDMGVLPYDASPDSHTEDWKEEGLFRVCLSLPRFGRATASPPSRWFSLLDPQVSSDFKSVSVSGQNDSCLVVRGRRDFLGVSDRPRHVDSRNNSGPTMVRTNSSRLSIGPSSPSLIWPKTRVLSVRCVSDFTSVLPAAGI